MADVLVPKPKHRVQATASRPVHAQRPKQTAIPDITRATIPNVQTDATTITMRVRRAVGKKPDRVITMARATRHRGKIARRVRPIAVPQPSPRALMEKITMPMGLRIILQIPGVPAVQIQQRRRIRLERVGTRYAVLEKQLLRVLPIVEVPLHVTLTRSVKPVKASDLVRRTVPPVHPARAVHISPRPPVKPDQIVPGIRPGTAIINLRRMAAVRVTTIKFVSKAKRTKDVLPTVRKA